MGLGLGLQLYQLLLVVFLVSASVAALECVDGLCGSPAAVNEANCGEGDVISHTKLVQALKSLHFDHGLLMGLPRDPLQDDTPRQVVAGTVYSSVGPRDPFEGRERHLVSFNADVAANVLGLEITAGGEEEGEEGVAARRAVATLLSGADAPPGAELSAYRYAGHQFGVFVDQLGDGRALSWGHVLPHANGDSSAVLGDTSEVQGKREEMDHEHWMRTYAHAFSSSGALDFHLKGTGKTPYSRDGDGLAVLRSSVREYLGSSALAGLRIPTALSLSLVMDSERTVMRDPLDDGHPLLEPAAVVARVAPSWLRFGTYEALHKEGKLKELRNLMDYTIATHFEHLVTDSDREASERTGRYGNADLYQRLLKEIVTRTAHLVAHWMANGFCHGVMNTDNMSVLGITIDLGPFGFVDTYDPDWICNHSDDRGRYKFGDQPTIGMWNVKRFSDSFVPFIQTKGQMAALRLYFPAFGEKFIELMRLKLGLGTTAHSSHTDTASIDLLLELLANCKVDYTSFFRELTRSTLTEGTELPDSIRDLFSGCADEPYTLDSNISVLEAWFMLYKKRFEQENISDVARIKNMVDHNPIYVLRNNVAQALIEEAESLDFSSFSSALKLLNEPFRSATDNKLHTLFSSPPPKGQTIKVGCSS